MPDRPFRKHLTTRGSAFALLSYLGAAVLVLIAIYLAISGAGALACLALGVSAIYIAFLGYFGTQVIDDQRSILEREHQQAELMSLQVQQQRAAVDTLADGLEIAIFICDTRALVQYANRKAVEMFRFPSAVGQSILATTLSHDLETLVINCVRTGQKQHAEMNFPYPNERVALAEAWLEPGAERIFLSLYEITDLRRLERIRQDFVANVSHELRTPLTTIRAMAETLQDESPEDELHERYLTKIVADVDRLSLIANDLLVLSSAESNPVRKQACDLADVYRTTVQQLERKATAKGLVLKYHGPDNLLVEANASQMSQVAVNLIDNAINYTAQGGVDITVSPLEGKVEIQVSDTGIGIPSEHLPRIFERFYRVDKGRSRATGGTGLGLSIVKHIVESHGGKVTVESALNQGSTFTVVLPIGTVAEPAQ